MKKLTLLHSPIRFSLLAVASALLLAAPFSSALAAGATVANDAVWVHGELYGTVLTDTSFKSPPPDSTDIIFAFMASGLEGQRGVAQYAPGDEEYNGGRWNVMLVKFTDKGKMVHDPDGDGVVNFELKTAEDVLKHAELGHLTIEMPGVYFECPLRPQQNR